MKTSVIGVLTFVFCSFVMSSAKAAFTTSRAAFEAANPGLATLDFEGIAPDGGFTVPAPDFSSQGVAFSAPPLGADTIAIADSESFFGTPTDALFVNQFNSTLTMNFAPTVTAAGFDIAVGFGQGRTATVNVFNGSMLIDTTSFATSGPMVFDNFIGFTGSPFTRITVTPSAGGFVLIDNLSFGDAGSTVATVPEPASMVMAVIGSSLLGLGAARRRRRQAAVQMS